MHRLRLLAPCAVLFLAVLVTGCGDEDSPTCPCQPTVREWHVPLDAPTIAAAADSAQQGEAIVVAPGTYLEHGIVLDVGIDLRGISDKADVVIDGQGLGRVLTIRLDEATEVQPGDTTSVIANLEIRRGAGDEDGGGGLLTELHTELRNVRFARNRAAGPGAGMRANSCDVELHSCEFDSNGTSGVTGHGGGLAVMGDGTNEVRADSCTFERNAATGSGGGAYVFMATLELTDGMFAHNGSTGPGLRGGGLEYVHVITTPSTVDGCVFANNTTEGAGGGASCLSPVAFTDCDFVTNQARRGGGVVLNQNSTVDGCVFAENEAVVVGGDDASGLGGAIHMVTDGAVVADCVFQINYGDFGSAIFSSGAATVRDCFFEGNVASAAGAVYWVGETSASVRHCDFAYNSAPSGAAFGLDAGAVARFSHCLFDTNTAGLGGAGYLGAATVTIDTCTATRNSADGYGGAFMAEYADPGTAVQLFINGGTVSGNHAADAGGGVFLAPDAVLEAEAVDFGGNTTAGSGAACHVSTAASATFNCCDILVADVEGAGTMEFITEGCAKRSAPR